MLGPFLEQLHPVRGTAQQLHRRAPRLEDVPAVGRGIAAEDVFEIQAGIQRNEQVLLIGRSQAKLRDAVVTRLMLVTVPFVVSHDCTQHAGVQSDRVFHFGTGADTHHRAGKNEDRQRQPEDRGTFTS